MPAYFIIELEVADPSKLVEYERATTEHVVEAGGRFIKLSFNKFCRITSVSTNR